MNQREFFREQWIANAIFAAMAMAAPVSAQTNYVVTDLGTLGGTSASANGINRLGQVVGTSATSAGQRHAYRTAANMPINPATDDLGTLGGAFSTGESINDSGQVAGSSSTGSRTHAFRSSLNGASVALTDLGTFSGIFNSFGRGINNSGQVTGEAHVTGTAACFFVFSNSAFRTTATSTVSAGDNLGTLLANNCRSAQGIGINDSGVVVGDSATNLFTGIPNHAFRVTGTTMVDIHTGPYVSSTAYKINASGQIVGTVTTAGGNNLCYRTVPGQNITFSRDDLGNLGGGFCSAFGINTFGDVVGASYTGSASHAFLYTNNVMYDLNSLIGTASSGVVLTQSTGINDAGQISAGGFVSGDVVHSHGFRLDPANVAVTNLTTLLSDASLALTTGQINSLTDKLNNALASIQAGLNRQAINQLNAFINSVEASLKTGKISAQAADTLLAAVNAIIVSLS